jgi:hypothetical protein
MAVYVVMLQIALIYFEMKHMNTLSPSHLFCYQCLAGKLNSLHFLANILLKDHDDSARKNCVYFVVCCLYTDTVCILVLDAFLTGPRGCSGKHIRIDGVVWILTHHFHQALGPGCCEQYHANDIVTIIVHAIYRIQTYYIVR